jgi:hypothetical protein
VKKARAFAQVMKRTDPTIELAGGGHNGWSDWDLTVLIVISATCARPTVGRTG